MTIEIGKYYIIGPGIPIWDVQLQQDIMFCNKGVVRACQTTIDENLYFGDVMFCDSHGRFTANAAAMGEIEFSPEAVFCEAFPNEMPSPVQMHLDFSI